MQIRGDSVISVNADGTLDVLICLSVLPTYFPMGDISLFLRARVKIDHKLITNFIHEFDPFSGMKFRAHCH